MINDRLTILSDFDNTVVELRAHNHYTMCGGKYDDGDTAIFNKATKLAEITWDQLHKQVAMIGVASIMLRKAKLSQPHNEFYKYMAGAFKQHKLEFDDAERIFDAVLAHAGCENCKRSERMNRSPAGKSASWPRRLSRVIPPSTLRS